MRRLLLILIAAAVSAPAMGQTILRQSTSYVDSICGFVAIADGITPVTSLDITTADDVEIIKAADTSVTDASGATWAAVTTADGCYNFTWTTAFTDTVGPLSLIIQDDSLTLPRFLKYVVVEEAVYDSLYASGGTLGTAQTGDSFALGEASTVRSGTIGGTGNDTTHIHLGEDNNYADDYFNNMLICLSDNSDADRKYCTTVDDFVGATSLVTTAGTLPVTPEASTDTYVVVAPAIAPLTDLTSLIGTPDDLGGGATLADNLSDTYTDMATATSQGTAQSDLDTITGADGVIVASANDGTQFTAITGAMALEATLGAPAGADLATDIANLHIIQSGYTGAWALGPFVSSTDHVTRVTSGTPACTRSTDAPNDSTALNGSTTISAAGAKGYSEIDFDATDTTATDYFRIDCTLSGADPLDTMFKVQQ